MTVDRTQEIALRILDLLVKLGSGTQEAAQEVAEEAMQLKNELTGDLQTRRDGEESGLGSALEASARAVQMRAESKSLLRRAAAEPRNFSKYFHTAVALEKTANDTLRRAMATPLSEADRETVREFARKLVTERTVEL